MTREQIEELRKHIREYGARDLGDGIVGELLAAAERALLLEDVLSAAKALLVDDHNECNVCRTELRAAIDRAEGRS